MRVLDTVLEFVEDLSELLLTAVRTFGAVLLSVGLAVYIVFWTVRDLADTHDAAGITTALGRLLLISAIAGVVASMVLEFAKRTGPLRRIFQARQVMDWFGPVAEPFDDARTTPRFPRFEELLFEHLDAPARRESNQWLASPIDFGAPLEILTAQLAIRFRSNPRYINSLVKWIEREQLERGWTYDTGSSLGGPDEAAQRTVDLAIERWLDSFHVVTRAKWVRWMRVTASGIAAGLAALAAAAADGRASVVIGLAAAGLVIGGPFAWITRDIVRTIERRSSP